MGSKFSYQNFVCVFSQKNEYFWGITILWIIFLVITKLNYFWGSFVCIFGPFLKAKVQNGIFFFFFFFFFFGGGAKISNSFRVCLLVFCKQYNKYFRLLFR